MVVITCFSFISILLNGMNIKHWLAAPQYNCKAHFVNLRV